MSINHQGLWKRVNVLAKSSRYQVDPIHDGPTRGINAIFMNLGKKIYDGGSAKQRVKIEGLFSGEELLFPSILNDAM